MRVSIYVTAVILLLFITISAKPLPMSEVLDQGNSSSGDKLVYADFEKVENGRPVSNNGGLVQIYTGQESTPVQFKGQPGAAPGAPILASSKQNTSNHFAAFDYALMGPNQWANVTLEIQGHPASNGQFVADDVSAYKALSMELYATGVEAVRVEFISHGQGIKLDLGFPQMTFRVKPGLNTYVVPFKSLGQPSWVQTKVDTKEVLKKLTAVSVSVFCNQCTPQQGTVAIDNLVFQK